MNRAEIARGFGWNVLFTFVNKLVIPLAVTVAIYRMLGPAELGIFATLATIVAVTDIFRDAGIGQTYVADPAAEGPRERQYAGLALLSAVLLAAVLLGLREVAARELREPQIAWGLAVVSVSIALSGLVSIPYSKLQRQARFRESGIVDTVASLVSSVLALVLVVAGFGFKGLVWQIVGRSVVHLVLVWRLAPVFPALPSLPFLRAVLGKSTSLLTQNLMYTLYTLGDQLVLARLLGKEAVGLYNAAKNLSIKPLDFITFPLSRTLFVAYSRVSEDRERFASMFVRSIAAASLASVPLFAVLAAFAGPVVLLLFGREFAGSIVPLQWFCLYFGFRSFGSLAGSAMVAAGRPLLNVLPWTIAFLVAGLGIWSAKPLTLNVASGWIAVGAATVYGLQTAIALLVLRPSRRDVRRIWLGLLPSAATAALGLALSLIPAHPAALVLVAMPLAACFHLAMVGIVFLRRPLACFSPSGAKALWHSL